MNGTLVIFRRELAGYFATPVAYVFIFFFLALASFLPFVLGGFFERGQADLQPFFVMHPFLYLLLVPAIGMRLWSEERRQGTIELLLTLPVSMVEAVLGKFLAAWLFTGVALAATFPVWITVNVLGSPDNGAILASYLGSLLMAGAYLAVGSCISALTRNQVIAFVGSVFVCFLGMLPGTGWAMVFLRRLRDVLPAALIDPVSELNVLTQYDAITRGVLDARSVVFFLSVIVLWLLANAWVVDQRKAD